MIKRSLYYWSRLFSEQLKEGQSYKELHPVISINIMHFNLLDETDAFHNIYPRSGIETGGIEIRGMQSAS